MCAIYGFLNYGRKVKNKVLKSILRELSIAAECRGTDATGISYVNNGEIVTFKQPKPAHKMKLFFPKDTVAVIGHNRLTTQGSEKKNCNNHPFKGKTSQHSFALAHNGVLYNDKEIKREKKLPQTQIETDSYVAAQLVEQAENVDMDAVKNMAEIVDGSFVFTILRDDNTLFLVKGSNPITLYHFPEQELYIYASTKEILKTALKNSRFKEPYEEIKIDTGDILQINSDGEIFCDTFETISQYHFDWHDWYGLYSCEESEDDLLAICNCFGVDREDVEFLYSCGYTPDEIEEMLFDPEEFPTEEEQNKERQRLFHILEDLVEWENSNNEEVLNAAKAEIMKSTGGNPPALLDPFAGGGAIPLEAQRLGLEAHAHDLNPVAVMINKAMIEIPPRFSGMSPVNPEDNKFGRDENIYKGASGLAADVRYYGEWMKQEAFKRIGHLYPKVKDEQGKERTVIAWMYVFDNNRITHCHK